MALSLKVNHAFGGVDTAGYHLFNLLVHLLTALFFLELARRTLRRLPLFRRDALPLALAASLLWAVHPLTTSAVTYISQRAESMMALFFLGTFLFVELLAGVPSSRRWKFLAVTSCFLCVLSKEVGYAVPLLLPLYDRAFLSASWREVWRERGRLYLVMSLSWVYIVAMLWGDPRSGTILREYRDFTPWTYLLTSTEAIGTYTTLLFRPRPLVIDYGWPIAMTLSEVWLQASALTLLFLAALWAQVKRPRLAFPLLWFFLILAPTSSFIPVMTEIMAEHRFYLPSMMVILLGVLLVYRSGVQLKMTRRAGMAAGGAALALVCVLLIGETRAQNRLYHDIVVMWRHNVRHTPENRRAIFNLAFELVRLKEYDEARELLERAVEIDPLFPDSFRELSYVHYYQGDITAALSNVEKAMELRPEDPFYHSARGAYLSLLGRQEEGLASVEKALSLDPRLREGLQWRSNILLLLGRYDEARQRLSEMTGIPPGSPELDKQLMSTAQALGKPEIAEEIGRLSRDRDATR